ncbi:NAD(P)/FAD-dependent oxidoreductase [Desulfurococcus mucosus]|uniref:Thioredoxin reductase (NADPH) n=1 Tax=Desulfurococcus mucosus (strain ATCC 35584 / DSM 2162 / JCM 9187 / O7/1) TaxID=765177 RepID=E8R789_DESM0|nr:FAD-dependent oxidoreductase [Desulfurococcus mucosus]ADV65554.1 thioredoxin reductase (NADPH) [Desulfurococcus mucosus DSM 2162]
MGFKFRITGLSGAAYRSGETYDVIVVGGGPAGLTAALYSARYGFKTIVVTKLVGGAVTEAPLVDDYPGIPEIPGNDLVDKFVKHVRKYNVPVVVDEVVNVSRRPEDNKWCVELRSGGMLCSYAVIIAVGSEKRKLGVPGEKELVGRGVSYCATCDGPLFKDKVVAVVGGGNAAFTSALYLAKLASHVYIIHRRDEFRAFKIYVDAARSNPKITLLTNTVVKELLGSEHLEAVKIYNTQTQREEVLKVDGLFIEIGLQPPVEFFKKIGLNVDETGRAVVNLDRSTNLPGIFVAGDAAGGPYKYRFEQVITAAADGAIAADAACKYICALKGQEYSR